MVLVKTRSLPAGSLLSYGSSLTDLRPSYVFAPLGAGPSRPLPGRFEITDRSIFVARVSVLGVWSQGFQKWLKSPIKMMNGIGTPRNSNKMDRILLNLLDRNHTLR